MNFIFGYQREDQVKVEKETPKLFLLAIGILIVILFLFVSFENIYEESSTPSSPFQASASTIQGQTLPKPDLPEMINFAYLSGI